MVPQPDRAPSSPTVLPCATVVVLGEALVDEFDDGGRVAGGAPFNVARWLAALGVPTCFISRIGRDDHGAQSLLDSARRVGLSMQSVQIDELHPTGRVVVTRTADGHSFAIGSPAAWDHIDADLALQALIKAAPSVVVFGSLAQRHAKSRQTITRLLQSTNAVRVADLNLRAGTDTADLAEHTLKLADWLKVNEDEWVQLLSWFALPEPAHQAEPTRTAPDPAAQALMQRFELQRVVVTCGERGWYTLNAKAEVDARGAAEPVPALVDTVGAGDSFLSVLVAGLARGQALDESLQAASRLAAAVCGQQGAMPNDDAFISHWRNQLTPQGATLNRTSA